MIINIGHRLISKYILLSLLAVTGVASIESAASAPLGGQVTAGQANITQTQNKTDIHQGTAKAILDWRSFDVSADEHVEFHQPSADSITLNRINDTKPSLINGTVTANGHIMLLNQNGIVFGHDAIVDVGALTVTTADIKNNDFMTGDYKFHQRGHEDAAILNRGILSAKEHGLISLVAPQIQNDGIITAKLGKMENN